MKVSIIVAVYNIEDYIRNCVKSLINQTYRDIEIILVDDGSKDSSSSICDVIAKTDERINVIHKENGGLSSARNAGLDIACGEYVMFVDGDDYLAENAIELLLEKNKLYDADIIQFDYEETYDIYKKVQNNEKDESVYIEDKKKMFRKLYEIGGSAASACTKLYKRFLFENMRFKEGILHEDEYMITYMLQKAHSVLYIPNKLYFYVMRQGSIIQSSFSKAKMDIFDVIEDRIKELEKLGYSEFLENEKQRFFATFIRLWCESKNVSDFESRSIMEKKIKRFFEQYTIRLSGGLNFWYILCKINPKSICIYYYLRIVRNKLFGR